MAGHSKWAKIHRQKGANDAKRGKIFSKHSKLISLAAKGGADPENNANLAIAIENAKKDNVPNTNIERAIKAGAGLEKSAQIEEILYEGYAPGGIAVMVEVLTDNKNRAAAEVRHAFSKAGGSLGAPGSVAFQFEKKGEILVQTAGRTEEEIMEIAMEAGADDLEFDTDQSTLWCDPTALSQVRAAALAQNLEIESAKVIWKPQSTVAVESAADAQKIMRLIEALDDLEDVDEITANFDIAEGLLE